MPFTCDIFCQVVDNFGDIGVTWRLARQLAKEHGAAVRLIIDDLASFHKLVPAIDPTKREQSADGVAVILWCAPLNLSSASDLVIEAFGCELPKSYVDQMTRRQARSVWINLEYLSAEPWVAEHHLLPSPHPTLPLTKFFFFPGFTPRTGGLIREADLIARRNATAKTNDCPELRVLFFAYEGAPVEALWSSMSRAERAVSCSITDGGMGTKLKHWRGANGESAPEAPPTLAFHVIPFVPQDEFDELLWRHDVLFVRGEDSFVRAQWAAKPFIWHIYPQSEGAHLVKLEAFLAIYCIGLPSPAEKAVRGMWQAWNGSNADTIGAAWNGFVAELPALNVHARRWAKRLSEMPDEASNLLSFYRKNVKI